MQGLHAARYSGLGIHTTITHTEMVCCCMELVYNFFSKITQMFIHTHKITQMLCSCRGVKWSFQNNTNIYIHFHHSSNI